MEKKDQGLGLAGLSAMTSGIAEKVILDDLHHRLCCLTAGTNPLPASRENIIQVLDAIIDVLGPTMSVHIGNSDDGASIVTDHPTIALLSETVGMLQDLDKGKTADVFRPNPDDGAYASLSTAERIQHETLAEALTIVQRHHKLPSLKAAAQFMAKRLSAAGRKRGNGKPYTAEFLRKLPYRSHKTPIIPR